MKLRIAAFSSLASFLVLTPFGCQPAFALRALQSVDSGLEEKIAETLGRSPSNPTVGLEEYPFETIVVQSVLDTLPFRLKSPGTGVAFEPRESIRSHLVQGAPGEWWIHFHLWTLAGDDNPRSHIKNGLMAHLVRSKEGRIIDVDRLMAEGGFFRGFVELDKVVREKQMPVGDLEELTELSRQLVVRSERNRETLEKAIHSEWKPLFILGRAVAPKGAVGLWNMIPRTGVLEGQLLADREDTLSPMRITYELQDRVKPRTGFLKSVIRKLLGIPTAGLEEGYAQRVKRVVSQQVREQLDNPRPSSVGVNFDTAFSKHPKGTLRFPHLALVKGAGDDWWIHLHLQSEGRDNGLLIRAHLAEGRIALLPGLMAEADEELFLAPYVRDMHGFVPVEGLSKENLDRLFQLAMNPRSLGGYQEALEKAIRKGEYWFVLAQAIAPAEKVGLYEMLDKRRFFGGPTVKRTWSTFQRMDIKAGLEEERLEALVNRLADGAQEHPGVLVITRSGLEEHPGLIQLARYPEFAGRMIFFTALTAAQIVKLQELGVRVIEERDFEGLVLALLSMKRADRVTVLEEAGLLAQALAKVLPPSMRVIHLKAGAQIKAILSAFVPEEEMDRFDAETFGVLARLLAA